VAASDRNDGGTRLLGTRRCDGRGVLDRSSCVLDGGAALGGRDQQECGRCGRDRKRCAAAELGFLHVAGAVNECPEDDGAVGNRDARYVIGANGSGSRKLRPFSTGRTYINFQTADEGEERVRATYGVNWDRLVEVKNKYDADNLFRANRNIRPGT
jgi:hypothetical protein